MRLQLRAPASVAGASLLLLAALTMAAPPVAGAQLAAEAPVSAGAAPAQCVVRIGVDTTRSAASDPAGVSRSPVRCPGFVATWDTVRLVLADMREVRGVLTRADSSGMYVSPAVGTDSVFYPIAEIRLAAIHAGSEARGASAVGAGALIGFGVGAALTVAAVSSSNGHETGIAWSLGILTTGATMLTGAVVGSIVAMSHVDQWTPFDPRTFRILERTASDGSPPDEAPRLASLQ